MLSIIKFILVLLSGITGVIAAIQIIAGCKKDDAEMTHRGNMTFLVFGDILLLYVIIFEL